MWTGCGSDDTTASTAADAGDVCAVEPAPAVTSPTCNVKVVLPLLQAHASMHVPEGTAVTYCTNPPSSGPHYPVWAAFQTYTAEVPKSYLVHDLEHGAVELFYRCDAGDDCAAIIASLEAIKDAQPQDPLCTPYNVKSRVILAPNSAIPTKIAAAAWGAVYTADCLDAPTLSAFVTDHYGRGPELLCSPGRTF